MANQDKINVIPPSLLPDMWEFTQGVPLDPALYEKIPWFPRGASRSIRVMLAKACFMDGRNMPELLFLGPLSSIEVGPRLASYGPSELPLRSLATDMQTLVQVGLLGAYQPGRHPGIETRHLTYVYMNRTASDAAMDLLRYYDSRALEDGFSTLVNDLHALLPSPNNPLSRNPSTSNPEDRRAPFPNDQFLYETQIWAIYKRYMTHFFHPPGMLPHTRTFPLGPSCRLTLAACLTSLAYQHILRHSWPTAHTIGRAALYIAHQVEIVDNLSLRRRKDVLVMLVYAYLEILPAEFSLADFQILWEHGTIDQLRYRVQGGGTRVQGYVEMGRVLLGRCQALHEMYGAQYGDRDPVWEMLFGAP
ncbi:hypothetical protein B0T19DRAFT_442819 [Cercophora scortea]|uniref:Uncharacterized protein n=1 Tax=Cercophora scortea TaxID=314031 RepID=A0AAE0IE84_9PEZI|nr:hypothetical protein B0T19DRAFT_442819 [Cercophora scortea]